MSAVSERVSSIDHLFLLSLLPRNQQMRVPGSSPGRVPRQELSVLKLASHLMMTSFLFLALVIATWVASWAFHSLHSAYPFSNELLRFLDRLELWLVYVDGALICATLLFGGGRYLLNIVRGLS